MARIITIRLNNSQFRRLRHQASVHHVNISQVVRALVMTTDAENDLNNRKQLDKIHHLLACIYSELLSRRFDWKVSLDDLDQINVSLKSFAQRHRKLSTSNVQNRLIVINNQLLHLLTLSQQEMNWFADLEKN